MIVIRRMVDRQRAYTAIFLKGEPPKIFPTSDAEHARILQVYKQDRPHEGILNDFAEDDRPAANQAEAPRAAAPAPWPLVPEATGAAAAVPAPVEGTVARGKAGGKKSKAAKKKGARGARGAAGSAAVGGSELWLAIRPE
jgi:uncharacterized membrane protein